MNSRNKDIQYFKQFVDKLNGHISLSAEGRAEKGPKVLIVGGTHGNESCGVQAILEWHKVLGLDDVLENGELHFLLGNPKAYLADTRYIDLDLNRSFLSQRNNEKSYEYARSKEIVRFLNDQQKFDVVLDLHSVSKGNSKMIVYNREQEGILDFVSDLSPLDMHLNFVSSHIPGLLIDVCQKHSPFNMAIECGNHHDPKAFDVAFYHIYLLLVHYKMIDFKTLSYSIKQTLTELERRLLFSSQVDLFETISAVSPEENFNFSIETNSTVTFLSKDSLFALSEKGEHRAPCDCYLMMPPQKVEANDIDAGFLCHKRIIERTN